MTQSRSTMLLEDKIGLVTGAGAGLGAAIAKRMYAYGAKVVLVDREADRLREVAGRLDPDGKRTLQLCVDVSDPVAVSGMVEDAVRHFGALHLAVNNAGFTGPREVPTADYEIDWWYKVIATDLGGVFFGLKYELPAILKSGGGAIVNMSSAAGVYAVPGEAPYIAAKHGIIGLTKAAALEYAKDPIRVTAVGPGFVDTEEMQKLPAAEREQLAALSPMGRMATPDEVAELTCFLLSDKAGFINGSLHLIDGAAGAR